MSSRTAKIIFVSIAVLISAVTFLVLFFSPDSAFADSPYMDISAKKIFNPEDASTTEKLYGGMTNIMSSVITVVLLPLGVFMVTWRALYLAIFPMMIHIDPLDLLRSGRYDKSKTRIGNVLNGSATLAESAFGGNASVNTARDRATASNRQYAGKRLDPTFFGGEYYNKPGSEIGTKAQEALKKEVKHMIFGLIIVFAIWGVLQLLMRLAIIVLDIVNASGIIEQ